jgi:hypothetical protein
MLHCTSLCIERYLGISSLLHAVAISWLERLPAGARVGVHDSGIVESDGLSDPRRSFWIARN